MVTVGSTLPGAEDDQTLRASVRVQRDLWEEFDRVVENRSAAVREFIKTEVAETRDDELDDHGERQPPTEPDLRQAWKLLQDLTSKDGWVIEERALPALAQEFGMNQKVARHSLVKTLDQRGYLRVASNMSGRFQSYRVYE